MNSRVIPLRSRSSSPAPILGSLWVTGILSVFLCSVPFWPAQAHGNVFTHTATNTTGVAQGEVRIDFNFTGGTLHNGVVLQNPLGCPTPTIIASGSGVRVIWPCDCVQPGQSVTFRFHGFFGGTPQSTQWTSHGPCPSGFLHGGLTQGTATAYLNSTIDKEESNRWAFTGNVCDSNCSHCPDPCPQGYPIGDWQDIGHPVDLQTGEVSMRVVDLRVPGRGIDWEFARRYRSRINFQGPLGFNWEFNYHMRLILDHVTGSFSLVDGNARSDIYLRDLDGNYLTPPGSFNRLTVLQGNPLNPAAGPIEIEIANRHMIRTRFFVKATIPGINPVVLRMTQVKDRNGNAMRFQYTEPTDPLRLTQVIDTYGRPYTYHYDAQGRLILVRDFLGREIVLGYDANGDLAFVRPPVVTGTPHGNDFPGGKPERYAYSSGFSDARLNHNLTQVIAPNEVADGSLTPRFRFQYRETAGHPDLDKATVQTWGGTNASGIPAGGGIGYTYGAGGPGGSVSSTRVLDRNGNPTEYYFDAAGHVLVQREFTRGFHPGEPPHYETQSLYNLDGQRTRVIAPDMNVIDYAYDSANPDRAQQGNLLSETRFPGLLGGDQAFLKRSWTYEPILNHMRTLVEERGNDPAYVPQNGGAWSPARYATTTIFDYQEGDGVQNIAFLAAATGLSAARINQFLAAAGMGADLPDQNGDGVTNDPFNARGNPIRVEQPTVNLLAGGPQALAEGDTMQQIVSTTVYNRFGQVVKRTDAEENVHERFFHPENDPDGDGQDILTTNGAGQPSDPGTGGYLRQTVSDTASAPGRETFQDPVPTNIRIDFFHDRAGNVIRTLDGRGVETRYFVNQLNQAVEIRRASDVSAVPGRMGGAGGGSENLSGQAFAYLEHVFFDANDNVIRRNIENRDGNTPDGGLYPGFIEHTYAFDILDKLLTETREVSPTVTLTTRRRYDPNQNEVQIIRPEGNVFASTWDERDLPLSMTRGFGSPGASTVTYNLYDGNRNLLVFRDAEDNNGDGLGDPTTRTFDGFDRETTRRDAVGSVLERHYDPAGSQILELRFGRIGGPSPLDDSGAGNVLLSRTEHKFDELSREFQTDRVLFVSAGVTTTRPVTLQDGPLTPGDLKVTTRMDYDRLSRARFRIEDDLDQHRTDYDGASREIRTVDAANNEVLTDYDDNANAVRVERIERHPEGQAADQRFVDLARFDSLDRGHTFISNLGHTRRTAYDSRDNPVTSSDAQGPPSTEQVMTTALVTLNLPGNTARTFYDGIDRVLKTEQDLRVGGQGQNPIDTSNPANPDGIVTLIQAWDGNSRLTDQADDLGNDTHYDHDALDRPFRETYADGRMALRTFDRDDNVRTLADQNGSVRTCTYDGVHRMLSCSVQRGPGVVGTTLQAWEYDGLFRSTRAFDDNEPLPATDDAVVTMAYDSLSREIEEHQKLGTDDRVVSWDIQDDDIRKSMVYPNGRRLAYTWDNLDRPKTITNVSGAPQAGLLASWEYIGPGRVLSRTCQNGTRMTVDYDGDQRVLQCRHLKGSQLLVGFGYTHDRMDNRLSEARQHLSRTSDGWDYDSIYRVVDQKRDIPQGGGTPKERRAWTLDGAQNWARLAITPASGGTQTFTQTMDPLNSYTRFQDKVQADDFNGNRKDDGRFLYRWDFLDRGRQVSCKAGGEPVSTHLYDAWGANGHLNGSGRRVRKTVTRDRHGCSGSFEAPEGGDEDDDTEEPHAPGQGCSRRKAADIRFLWDGWSLVEERDAATLKVLRQHVDMGMDRHLCMDAYKRNGTRLKRTLFYHEDAKGWVAALTDKQGHVRERYAYDAYGMPAFQDKHGRARHDQRESRFGNPHLYNGCYFDSETRLYLMRHRVYSPAQGRFYSRDPIGIWGDGVGSGNGYAYVGGNAVNGWDPEGLDIDNTDGTEPVIYKDEFSGKIGVVAPGQVFKGEHDGLIEPSTGDVIKTGGKKILGVGYEDDVVIDSSGNVTDIGSGSGKLDGPPDKTWNTLFEESKKRKDALREKEKKRKEKADSEKLKPKDPCPPCPPKDGGAKK